MTASHLPTTGPVDDAGRAVRRAVNSPWLEHYAHFGYAAKGVVYLIIGGLAGAAALGIGGALTDQTGAVRAIYQRPFGGFLLIVGAIGWLGYALWCELEALLDTENKGTKLKGILTRVGYGVVGLIYIGLAVAALGLALHKGNGGKDSNAQAQDWTALLLRFPAGVALVVLGGLIVLAIAAALFYRAYKADFRAQLRGGSGEVRTGIVVLGRIGYAALSVVFTIIGFFLIVAATRRDPHAAKGLGGALGTLLGQPFGHLLLALVALGLIAYGIYSLSEARYRRIGPV